MSLFSCTRAWAAAWALALAAPVWAGPAFRAPSELPAVQSPLAIRAPVNALALAGQRMVAAGQRGHILYSDDGKAWVQAAAPSSADLTALSFPTPRQGWAVGHEGSILHTDDGGTTWRRAAGTGRGEDKPLLDVWFEDEKKGFAVGAFNLVLRTEDGGQSWTSWSDRVDNPRELHLYAVRPAGGSVFIVGEQGLVLKLDRERGHFVRMKLPYQGTLFGVVGTPAMTLVFGLRGNAWRSADGGENWMRVETGVDAGLTAGAVRADGTVVLASQAGHVLFSTDGGANFGRVKRAVPAPVFAVADAGQGGVALAGVGGVKIEDIKK